MANRIAYPVVLTPDECGYLVYVPAFNIDTSGKDMADAMEMARDAIGIVGIEYQDQGLALPNIDDGEMITEANDIVTYVDIDFDAYRLKCDNRRVRKNVTIPYYLNLKAEKLGLNFSRILEEALLVKVGY
ncbi:type II toxin-antitoxin system HicB family antitoxin [Pseudobutyrivibrio ruminis]|uniref:HicB family protein n=1 Tax=Pseudobutyrivibrio ruminis TaxID=46206 RepID=A0A2G3DTQ1_9FIRM|nr:type II toxin-antitoxin system HicB family antitoxin [Pseudobutyrivibrio ruminis]PHU34416.1 HicB family protein [Pseudobutyrivibrio ruminis]